MVHIKKRKKKKKKKERETEISDPKEPDRF